MTLASAMAWSPSVRATAPASSRNCCSVISAPLRPLVNAPMAWTRTGETSRARASANCTSAGSSSGGSVSGWATKVVIPPAAAASPAERKLSRCRAPGSPTKTRMSTMPGASGRPPQSITVPSPGEGEAPRTTSSITPPETFSAPGPS